MVRIFFDLWAGEERLVFNSVNDLELIELKIIFSPQMTFIIICVCV